MGWRIGKRRLLVWLLRGAAGIVSIPLAWFLAALLLGAVPANVAFSEAGEDGVTIFILSNGVHTWIVMPKVNADMDWRLYAMPQHLRDPRWGNADHVAIGYGNRDFYLNTPTWGDLTVRRAFGAFFGHLYPIWLKFAGGKGVATLFGLLVGFSLIGTRGWLGPLAYAIVWLGMLAVTRISSVAGLSAAVAAPVAAGLLGRLDLALLFLGFALMVIWKHRTNIGRLLNGTEPKIGQGGKTQDAAPSVKPNWNAETRSNAEPCGFATLSVSSSFSSGSRNAIIAASRLFSPSLVLSVKRGELPSATQRM